MNGTTKLNISDISMGWLDNNALGPMSLTGMSHRQGLSFLLVGHVPFLVCIV